MSLRNRKSTIRSLVPRVRGLVGKHGVITEFEVPGSKPHSLYHVYLSEKPLAKTLCDGTPYYEYRCSCHDKSSLTQLPPCPGNSASSNRRDTVCKHCIAALINRLGRNQVGVFIADWSEHGTSLDNAERLLRFGGSLIKLVSNQGNGSVWLVGKRDELKTKELEPTLPTNHLPDTSKLSLVERTNLFRPEQDYID